MPSLLPLLGSLQFPFYRNPFHASTHLEVGRIDQGVDYHGAGPIGAIGKCRIIGDGGRGWPGGHYLLYQLLRGRHKGRYVYVAEAIRPCVHAGQLVSKGQVICYFGKQAAPGQYPGIETGWGSPVMNETLAASTTGYTEGEQTTAGKCFARFLHRIGAPAPPVPPGVEYPTA